MPRPIGTTFADLLGKLTVVRVECSKYGRFGRYPLHRLIDRHGATARSSIGSLGSPLIARASAPPASATSAMRGARICRGWCENEKGPAARKLTCSEGRKT